jgi:hypothetical protein
MVSARTKGVPKKRDAPLTARATAFLLSYIMALDKALGSG